MSYRMRNKPENTKEIAYAGRFAKLLTEDMGLNLEAVGFHIVRNHPVIVARRLDVMALTAGEEYDKLMVEYLGENHANQYVR